MNIYWTLLQLLAAPLPRSAPAAAAAGLRTFTKKIWSLYSVNVSGVFPKDHAILKYLVRNLPLPLSLEA